ncbi:hypothetical protein STEG23_005270 [Scotinomys teguina]
MTVTPLGWDQDCSLKIREPEVPAPWFLDPGGWSKTAAVRLFFIFPGICTLSLDVSWDSYFLVVVAVIKYSNESDLPDKEIIATSILMAQSIAVVKLWVQDQVASSYMTSTVAKQTTMNAR